MIQLSAMPSAPGTANMAEFLGNGGADAGESTNFGVLLAVRIGTETVLSAPATAAIPAPALPDTGKILPPALPRAVLPLARRCPILALTLHLIPGQRITRLNGPR